MAQHSAAGTAGDVVDKDVARVVSFILQERLREERMNRKLDAWEKKVHEIQVRRPGYFS